MSPEQARAVLKREGWNFLDLFGLVEAFAELTDGGLDARSPRVRVVIKRLPLRKRTKKVKP